MQLEKRYEITENQQKLARELAGEYNIAPKVMNLIFARGMDTRDKIDEFLLATEEGFSSPFDLKGMEEGVARLKIALAEKQRIFLVCDYDCDGLSGLGIFMRFFQDKDCIVESYIPEREEGYGLNFDNIKPKLEQFKPSLLITCDMGVTSVLETEKIKEMGIDVIITDHHLPKEILPKTTIINPKLQSGATEFCGAGVVFKLLQGMGEDYRKYIELACIATIGDSVPLIGENRLIVKAGLAKMNSEPSLLVEQMAETAKIKQFDSQNIAFGIVPRLNAGGRMGRANLVKELVSLSENEYSKCRELCEELSRLNAERQDITAKNFDIAREISAKNSASKVLVLYSESFFVGILGIIASKITEEFARPTVVLTKVGKEIKGSARSVFSIDINKHLAECSGLFKTFGGHKMACGLSLEEENLQAFQEKMQEVASKIPNEEFEERKIFDEEVSPAEVTIDFLHSLASMEPFGEGNPPPIFHLKGGRTNFRKLGERGEHIVGMCDGLKIVGFRSLKYMEKLNQTLENNLLVNLQIDKYGGGEKPSSILRYVLSKEEKFSEEETYLFDTHKFERATLCDVEECIKKSPFSTLILASSKNQLEELSRCSFFQNLAVEKSYFKEQTCKNAVLVNPTSSEGFALYKNIFTMCDLSVADMKKSQKGRIKSLGYLAKTHQQNEVVDRETFTKYYKILRKLDGEKYRRLMDIYYEMCVKSGENLQKQTAFFAIDVLRELGILVVEDGKIIFTQTKSSLDSSIIYQNNQRGE